DISHGGRHGETIHRRRRRDARQCRSSARARTHHHQRGNSRRHGPGDRDPPEPAAGTQAGREMTTPRGITMSRLRQCSMVYGAVIVVAICGSLGSVTAASAGLTLMNAPVTFKGPGGYSADALGQNATGGTIQAEVPAGSTVLKAFLYGVTNGVFANSTDPAHPTITIDFDGTEVTPRNLNSSHSFL